MPNKWKNKDIDLGAGVRHRGKWNREGGKANIVGHVFGHLEFDPARSFRVAERKPLEIVHLRIYREYISSVVSISHWWRLTNVGDVKCPILGGGTWVQGKQTPGLHQCSTKWHWKIFGIGDSQGRKLKVPSTHFRWHSNIEILIKLYHSYSGNWR